MKEFWLMPHESDREMILFWALGKDPDRDQPFQIVERYCQNQNCYCTNVMLSIVDQSYDLELAVVSLTVSRDGSFELNYQTDQKIEAPKEPLQIIVGLIRIILSENPVYVSTIYKATRVVHSHKTKEPVSFLN